MLRFKLTSPGVLLILAVVAAGGIFLLDLFFLHPHIDAQKWAALQEEAVRIERTAELGLGSQQEELLRRCRAWARRGELARMPAQRLAPGPAVLSPESLRLADVDRAWLADPRGRLLRTWSAEASPVPRVPDGGAGPRPADPAAGPAAAGQAAPEATTGFLSLAGGVALFARVPVRPAEGEPAVGFLSLARRIEPALLDELGTAVGGELSLLSTDNPPEGILSDSAGKRAVWLSKEDQLTLAWLARDPRGRPVGYFLADVPVVHIHRQAVASRRMVLIILALSVGLALLVILGTHMLITGPVVRLLGRLQRLDSGEGTPESLARDLHGEPLMLARRLTSTFERLAYISKTDELTGLANRRHFEELLEHCYEQARRYDRPLSLLVMDIDFFKAVNDAAGHQAGDEVLRAVADDVRDACRRADVPARLGGDEFAILLPETTCDDAEAVGQRIRRTIARRAFLLNNLSMNITASIGIANLGAAEADGPGVMLAAADRALYAAKQGGRNRIVQARDLGADRAPAAVAGRGKVDVLSKKLAGLDSQFKDLFLQAIEEVMTILHQRDPHMANHTRKVQHYAGLIAEQMGLSPGVTKRIEIAAMMHDLGMLAMSDDILLCPGRLSDEQRRIMRHHPLLSVRIMERMEFLEQEIPAVRHHHERYDGTGYPEGLAGAAIPLTARILAVADAFDAMTSPRIFRKAKPRAEALVELRRGAGTQFDPAVVEAFLAVAQKLREKLTDVPGVMSPPRRSAAPAQAAPAAWREVFAEELARITAEEGRP